MKHRGYVYPKDDGWVLASEPNLKTCCLNKQDDLIALHGDFSACQTHHAYTVIGRLEDHELFDAQLSSKLHFPFWTLLAALAVLQITLAWSSSSLKR